MLTSMRGKKRSKAKTIEQALRKTEFAGLVNVRQLSRPWLVPITPNRRGSSGKVASSTHGFCADRLPYPPYLLKRALFQRISG